MQNYEKKPNHKDFPYSIRNIKGMVHNKLVSDFQGQPNGVIQVGPEKWLLQSGYEKFAEKIYNFEARPDDVWICTLPRSGTTWTQEMIWLLCNDLDYETASKNMVNDRFPYLE